MSREEAVEAAKRRLPAAPRSRHSTAKPVATTTTAAAADATYATSISRTTGPDEPVHVVTADAPVLSISSHAASKTYHGYVAVYSATTGTLLYARLGYST
jgi:hypothetical protein